MLSLSRKTSRPNARAITATLSACAAALITTFATTPHAQTFHLADSLHDGTAMGHPVGGSFAPDGWHVTDRRDRMWFALPRLVSGSVEFTLGNVTMASLGDGDNEMFAMYEAGYGISEPISYGDFRVNHYKCMLRVYGNSETGREGEQKLMWGMCPGGAPGHDSCSCGTSFFEEPFGGNGTWDGSPNRIRIEWGGGVTRYSRNGTVVLTINWAASGLTFGPSELHLSLGTSRPSAVDYARLPVGAVFSDLVIDGTEGPLAVCPGSVVPDAGTAPVDSGTASGTVLELPAIEDVTVEPGNPTTVYADPRDLAVGHNDAEFYLKFRVPSVAGRVVGAQLLLNSQNTSSAVGTGADVFAAAHSAWSETTLTFAARPGPTGSRLARVDGITVDQPYTFALPAGSVTGPGVYVFAVLPQTSDLNSAHFDSKEVSPARGPRLRLTIDPSMPPIDAGSSMPDSAVSTDVVVPVMDAGTVRDAMIIADVPRDARRDTGGGSEGPEVIRGGCGCHVVKLAHRRGELAGFAFAVALAGLARRRRRTPQT